MWKLRRLVVTNHGGKAEEAGCNEIFGLGEGVGGVARNNFCALLEVLGDVVIGIFAFEEVNNVDGLEERFGGDRGAISEVLEGFLKLNGPEVKTADAKRDVDGQ